MAEEACGTTFATASFFKNGAMNLKVGILAAIGSFAGSALGAHIVLMLSDEAVSYTHLQLRTDRINAESI